MKRTTTPFKLFLAILALAQCTLVSAQTKYWTGGSGQWNDAAHWSNTMGGAGGAGIPRVNEDVVIAPSRPVSIQFTEPVWCRDISVEGDRAAVTLTGGAGADINIAGAWHVNGTVHWNATGPVHLIVRREGVEVDLKGVPIAGDIVLNGSGSWSVLTAFTTLGDLHLQQGTLITNGNVITARGLIAETDARKELIAGNGLIALHEQPDRNTLRGVVNTGTSTLVVDDVMEPWGFGERDGSDRDVNICGTGAGQTPFTVTTTVVTNYNGFGVRCRGNCNATVSVTVTGGSGNFSYQWLNGGPPTQTWTTACGGPQLVVVTDVVQGVSCPVQVQVSEPAPLGVIFFGQSTPPTCSDVCDGSRTSAAIGGVSPYTYSWNNGAGTSSSFNMLCAGSNTLRITDANNCIFDTTFVFNVAPITPNLTFNNAGCNGVCDGTATVAPMGGTGAYTVTWTPPVTTTDQLHAVQLCAGNYSVNVRDANGCNVTTTFMITQPPPIVPDLTHTDATCFNACNGTAMVAPTGATGPFTFLWTPAPGGTGQGTSAVTGLCAGNYTVRITDVASGCFVTTPFAIAAPPAITVQGTVTDALCANTCDGRIVLNVNGGTPGYTYTWTPQPPIGQGSGSVSGLCPGNWTALITDAVGCDTTVTFMVGAPPPLVPTLTTSDVSCAGVCDGTASTTVSGGTAGYTFIWTPAVTGAGTPNATQLCAGMYTLLIRDANLCDTTLTFEITEPLPLTATQTQTNVTCGTLCDATATVEVTGGTTNYTYNWDGPATPMGEGTPSATGLCAGMHTVLITDARGCTLTKTFTILPATPIDISLALTPASCPSVCDGRADATVTGGTAPYTYSWLPLPLVGNGTPNASGLCPGAYTLAVADSVGCDTTTTFTIIAPAVIDPHAMQTNVSCAGTCDGSITLAPTGGNGTFTYVWSPPAGAGPIANGRCAGPQQVSISSGGCDTTITILITEPPPITASAVVTNASCSNSCDGSAIVNAAGGAGGFTYLWTPQPGAGQGTATPSAMCPGDYSVAIRDLNGCLFTLPVIITAPQPFVPTLTTFAETCAGPCTGRATVTFTGGTGFVDIIWAPPPGGGQHLNTATFLCANVNYTVTLTDASGCDTTLAFTIAPSSTIVPNSSSTPVTCPGACDGTATVGPTGGVAPYTIIWSPPPAVQGQPTATGLCEGPVQVIITDAEGCISINQVLITGPQPITDNEVISELECSGDCNADITLDVQGGTGPYTYAWTPPPPIGAGTGVISGLCTGVRNVLITDENGCTATFTYNITTPAPISVQVFKTPSQCQVCAGAASVIASGGTGQLTVQWLNGDGILIGTDTAIVDLCADVYTLIVTDENGCSVTESVPITDTDGESILATGSSTSCPDICDGVISVDFNCGLPPCHIEWTNSSGIQLADTTNMVSGLCPGNYFVAVTNGQGCTTIDTVTVMPSADPTLAISTSPVSCTAQCDGTATVGVTAGIPPFTFSWSPEPGTGQGTPHITGLCAGTYTVTVTTGGGCTVMTDVLITEPPPINIVGAFTAGISCAGVCDGNLTMIVNGGSPPYTFNYSPQPAAGQGSPAAFGFCAGQVTVVITDRTGCSVTRVYPMPEPLPIQVFTTATASSCPICDGTATATVIGGNGQNTFSWLLNGVEISTEQAPTGLCGGLYTLNVRDMIGCSVQTTVQIPSSEGEILTPVNGQTLCGNDCNGEVSVDFTCSLPDCTVQWFDPNGDPIGGNSNTLTNLCNGTYTVQVTNANGCVTFAEATVSPSQTIIPNLSTTQASCAGICDATATVGPLGGVIPYEYTWTPAPGAGQDTPQATGLCAGVYEVLIADASGCDTTVSVLILEPQPLAQTAAITNITCNATCNGNIVVTPTGGTAPYTYFWDPVPPNGQGSNGAFDLCAGDYDLVVTDAHGCTAENSWTVEEPTELMLAGGSVDSQCGLCNGIAFVAPSGGTAPFIFTWTQNGNIFGTGDTLSPVCPGLYTVMVTDSLGCSASLLVPVQDENGEDLTTIGSITSCPGVCDGTAEVSFNCSVPACTIAWYDATGTDLNLSAEQISGLCSGLYLVSVTSGNGCVSIDSAYVTEPLPIVPNISSTPVTCFGDCDGVATLGPTGGIEPYTFVWTQNVNGQGTPQATDLCIGAYEVTITDDGGNGCSLVTSVLILGPDLLVPGAQVIPITCNGACDGTIVLTPDGGTPTYSYNWITEPPNGPGSNTGANLCAQDWVVQITDMRGCDTTVTITITDPLLLEAQLNTTDNSCFGECIGTSNVIISGGVQPYTLVWTGPSGTVAQDTTAIASLCAGSYSLSVTDSSGCAINLPFTITEGSQIEANLSFTGETCNGPCDGTAAVAPAGGAGGFTFDWQPSPGPGPDQVTDLCAGNYTVTISDQLSCDTTIAFTLLPYTPISNDATVNDVLCNGACDGSVQTNATGGIGALMYAWTPPPPNGPDGTDATGLCPQEIALIISDAAGCDTSFTYTITEPLVLEVSVDLVTDASCTNAFDGAISTTAFGGEPPYAFAWTGPNNFNSGVEDIANIEPGVYELTVTDDHNCTVVTSITVNALVSVVADAGADLTACSNTVVTLDGSASSGATTYRWTNDQGGVIGDSAVVDLPLQPEGTYTYVLTVTDGPCSSSDTVVITYAALPIANAGPDQFIFLTEVATLGGAPSGPLGSTFSWAPDTLVSDPAIANPTTSPTVTTWFVLSIVGPNGCLDTDSVLVTVEPTVVIPTGFTPNSDGRNDTWVIDFIELFPECVVEVYNRWGDQLFRSVGYQQPWTGKYKDGYVPVGTYYYVIDLHDPRFPEAYTGPLTVIR